MPLRVSKLCWLNVFSLTYYNRGVEKVNQNIRTVQCVDNKREEERKTWLN